MPEDFVIKDYVIKILEENEKLDLRPRNMGIDDFLRYVLMEGRKERGEGERGKWDTVGRDT